MRQDVWSKKQWEAPEPDAGTEPPTVFDAETRPAGFQPAILTKENRPAGFEPKVLTGGEKSGIMTKVQGNFNPVSPSLVVPTLRRESAAWISSLTSEEVRAIQKYTKNDGDSRENRFFARLNAMLRGDIPKNDNLQYYADLITSALQKNHLQHDIVCYRNMSFNPFAGVPEGNIIQVRQFLSSSVTKAGALSDAFSIVIYAPKGSNGAYIEKLSAYPSQREFLFNTNCIYKILSIGSSSMEIEVIV